MGNGRPPLVPAACDLAGLKWFPLDIDRLLGSQFHAGADDTAWRAGVTLWIKSFRQVPAASLPADDDSLARLADLGRDVRTWRRVRRAALHGWLLCNDGRLYHPVVAERALAAWIGRINEQRRSAAGNRARGRQVASLGQLDGWLGQAREALVMLPGRAAGTVAAGPSGSPPDGPQGSPQGSPQGGDAPPLADGWQQTAGYMARVLREAGVRVASTHPVLLGWVADGLGVERVLEAVELARQYKPAPEPLAPRYLDAILRNHGGDGYGGQATNRNAARGQRAAALTGRGAAGGAAIDGEFREV